MRKINVAKPLDCNINKTLRNFSLKYITFVGINYFKPNEFYKFGVATILFTAFDKSGNVMYYQMRYELENEEDKKYIVSNPFNVNNMSKEIRETTLKNILSDLKAGVNLLHTNLDFYKLQGKYHFEGAFYDAKNSVYITQCITLDTTNYIRLSQFNYWFTSNYPLLVNIFDDPKYNNIKVIKVDKISYEGSCDYIRFDGDDMILTHFTLYYRDSSDDLLLDQKRFGFNLPYKKIENKIPKKPLLTPDYMTLFNDDTVLCSDRVFFVSNPTKAILILKGSINEDHYKIFMIDMKSVEKYHLLDIEENIFLIIYYILVYVHTIYK